MMLAGLLVGIALVAVLLRGEIVAVRRAVVVRRSRIALGLTAVLAVATAVLVIPRLTELLT